MPASPCPDWAGKGSLSGTRGFIPLIFGESTVISDELLDARGRRLLRRLEEAGWASISRHEGKTPEGAPHITFAYHLRSKATPNVAAHPNIQRAIDDLATIYDQLPEVAWKHPHL